MCMQGKPVKDACAASCSSPPAALNHLSMFLDSFTADSLYLHIYIVTELLLRDLWSLYLSFCSLHRNRVSLLPRGVMGYLSSL